MTRLEQHLRWQAGACRQLGSPLYAVVLQAAADDLVGGGPVADVLSDVEGDPDDAAVGLRLGGAVHRLVLAGRAPALAAHYPSVGGTPDLASVAQDFLAVVTEHREEVREGLGRAPQTNEVGRGAALLGALCALVAAEPLPVHLHEIGASGGLNLRADHFRVEADDGRAYGAPESPVVLPRAWEGLPVEPVPRPEVRTRTGSDVHPVDATTEEGRLHLLSYVWPDQVERVERLRGALDLALRVPAELRRCSAVEHVRSLQPADGAWTVLWHSVMWQYLEVEERAAALDALTGLGAAATAAAPVAHVRLEPRVVPDATTYVVEVRTWPGEPAYRLLAEAQPHGVPVRWRT